MEFIETSIDGLVQIIPTVYNDSRGWFYELFKASKFQAITGGLEFRQDNISFSKKNVIRGLHLQLDPSSQAKIATVISGRVLDVVVDTRKDSPTFGKTFQVELNSSIKNILFIPKGMAHGFSALEDSYFLYQCSNEYDPATETGIIWNDPDLNIDWQVQHPILSEKDKQLPTFKALLQKSVISH